MNTSVVKAKLEQGEPVLVLKEHFASPRIVEMMGYLGYDCLWICNEHLGIDESQLDTLILAARSMGMDVMLRRNMSGYQEVLRPLEMGVHGFMIPRVRSVEYIKNVVDYVKFPPLGHRGVDAVNVDADYGFLPLEEYLKRANEETFIVAQIEDKEAIPLIDDVAAVEGVDILFVGPLDLSVSLGIPGKFRDPRVIEVIDAVAEACAKHGKYAGTPALGPDDTKSLIDKGFRFFTGPSDFRFVKKGFTETKETFQELGFTFRSPGN
jgi:4-hydroxy-2-oxoheptanedioate aldolase